MIDVRTMLNGSKSKNTVNSYTNAWKKYKEFCGGSEDEMFKSENFAKWRQYMVNENDYAAATINANMRGVRSIIRALAEHKIVSRETKWEFSEVSDLPANALRERRRPHNRVRIEAKQIRRMIKKTKPDLMDPLKSMHRALLLVLGTTGMRISEAINIELDDIDKMDGGYIIRNVMSKHDEDPRVVPLSTEAYEAIMDWVHIRPVRSNYVFVAASRTKSEESDSILWNDSPMCRTSAYRVIKKYGKKIGVPHLKPHDLRRFVGTTLAKKKDIRVAQKVLGHKSIDTTMRYYVLDEDPIGVTEKLF